MAFQKKAEIEQQKAFISKQEEKYRPAYGRNEIVYPRRCVFAATTNRDDWAVDETGNRRFLPVKTIKVDVAGLKRDRNAIWAAAYAEYVKDPMWWLTDDQAIYAAKQTQKRFEADIWIELIHKYLSQLTEISIRDAFEGCFHRINHSKLVHAPPVALYPHLNLGVIVVLNRAWFEVLWVTCQKGWL